MAPHPGFHHPGFYLCGARPLRFLLGPGLLQLGAVSLRLRLWWNGHGTWELSLMLEQMLLSFAFGALGGLLVLFIITLRHR